MENIIFIALIILLIVFIFAVMYWENLTEFFQGYKWETIGSYGGTVRLGSLFGSESKTWGMVKIQIGTKKGKEKMIRARVHFDNRSEYYDIDQCYYEAPIDIKDLMRKHGYTI